MLSVSVANQKDGSQLGGFGIKIKMCDSVEKAQGNNGKFVKIQVL